MKIAFTGAHSTGKTTLLREIESRFSYIKASFIRNITRNIIERGFPLAKESNVDSYVNYVRDQLQAERLFDEAEFKLLISDRTVLDAYGYATVNRELPRPFVPNYFIEMLGEIARAEARFYDLFVLFPVEFPMTPDPVRPNDERYRRAVGAAIEASLQNFQIPHLVLTGSIDERIVSLQREGVLL